MFDAVDIGLAVVGKEALHEEGEGFVQLALRLGRDGIEDQRRFPGAGHAGKDGQLAFGNVQRDVLEIVLAGAAHFDKLAIRHARLPLSSCSSRCRVSCLR